jgi:lipopolysaccharide/colanic/teichoic acid biosynthesis glycosyltransferase
MTPARRAGLPLEWRFLVVVLIAVDAVTVAAAFVLAYVARYGLHLFELQEITVSRESYVEIGLISLPIWCFIFAACGLYRTGTLLGGPREYALLVNACTFGFASIAVLSFLTAGSPSVSRGWLVAVWPLAIATTGAGRFVVRRVAYALRGKGLFITSSVIVGANAQGVAIARQLDAPRSTGIRIVGFLDDYLPSGANVDDRWMVLGAPSLLPHLAVDEAVVVQHALTWESLHELMRALAGGAPGPAIRLAPTFVDLLTAGMSVGQRGTVPVITLNRSRIAGLDAVLKTGFEYALTFALLIAIGPVLVWKALRRSGRGPVLTHHHYAGAGGTVVDVPTFAEEAPPSAKVRRVIEKGPALFSVLRGDIALIGPQLRPSEGGPGAVNRVALQSVKPGLTGPVSVAGDDISPESALALELSYVRDYSIWRDLHIVWQRVLLMFGSASHPSPEPEVVGAAPETGGDQGRFPLRSPKTR